MCGIAGFLLSPSTSGEESLIERMTDSLAHRGPDAWGWHVEVRSGWGMALGHRRLSIIDLALGGQPMQGPRGEWIVFNGEIYNYKELRAHHEARGYSFKTHSDTEVILAAWEPVPRMGV